ncbi:hypothetical protein H0H81_006165 [Sphagnurus paluster]|uniref:Uncharacterized protein n=1 Tax=Sphagnurus paluster TaxID=117069 RepID=A0A9P7K5C0_9AGAR|nr:hypothetical protein H0H81_006165 [Sphagnurus paluster]
MPNAPDPILEPEPDFASEAFAEDRQILADDGVAADRTAATLQRTWLRDRQRRHDEWQAQQADQQPQPGGTDNATAQTDDTATKQAPKPPEYPVGQAPLSSRPLAASQYARSKTSKNEWVEHWYFTKEGCLDAERPTTSIASDTFGLTTGDDNSIQLRAVSTAKHSPRAVDDTYLSWDQIMVGAKTYTETLSELGFPPDYVKAWWTFFTDLDWRRARMRASDTDKIFIHYVSIMRKEFFRRAGSTQAFDISKFSQGQWEEIAFELRNDPQYNSSRTNAGDMANATSPHHVNPDSMLRQDPPPTTSDPVITVTGAPNAHDPPHQPTGVVVRDHDPLDASAKAT